MGLGSTAKKVQKLADVAEQTYKRLNDLRDQIAELRSTLQETGDRVEELEEQVAAQRAVLDAIAAEHDLDPDQIVEDLEQSGEDLEQSGTDADAGSEPSETPATES